MARIWPASVLYLCAWLLALARFAECGGYAAFMTDQGTQLIVLNSSGNLTYSPCNSGSTPQWSSSSPLYLPAAVAPRVGSSIAAVGFITDGVLYADVFWQNTGLNLEHERYKCNSDDGTYSLESHDSPDGEVADDTEMPDVSMFTGLAVVRLALLAGTRLFCHDVNGAVRQLELTPSNTWEYIGIVNPDGHLQGPALGPAVINGTAEMYTVEARGDSNLEIASTASGATGDTWSIETMPRSLTNSDTSSTSTQNFTVNTTQPVLASLEAWPSQVGNLGMAIDQDSSKYIFYIGSDMSLYYVTAVADADLGGFSIYNTLDTKYWPLADDAAADFAVAHDPSTYDIRLYYMSGNSMTEVSRTGKDTWAEAAALPTVTRKTTTSGSSASATPTAGASKGSGTATADITPSSTSNSTNSLSKGAQAGIGIGASLAGLAIIGAAIAFCLARRKAQRNRDANDEKALSFPGSSPGSSPGNTIDHARGLKGGDSYYGNHVAAEGGSRVMGDNGTLKDMMHGEVDRQSSYPGLYVHQQPQRPASNVVYVPAHELPNTPQSPRYEMSGGDPPVELHSQNTRAQPELHRGSSFASSTTAGGTYPGHVNTTFHNGRTASVSRGPLSPMSELDGTDMMQHRPSQDTWVQDNQGYKKR